ncbi:MAG: nucleotidyltransferase family protein [Dissulfuribacterales bacterium]
MKKNTEAFTAVVLAGDRGPGDPMAMEAGVPSKSLVPVNGIPMLLRVLNTLDNANKVDSIVVCGSLQTLAGRDSELNDLVKSNKIGWIENLSTPSSSICHVLDSLENKNRVLVTTSDHALLNPEIVNYFCCEAEKTDCDVVAGLTLYEGVMHAYPETRRTAIKLSDGAVCSCNLFAFLTSRARGAVEFWQKIEGNRKKPWHMMTAIGWTVVLRYLLGKLSLANGLNRISKRMNLKAEVIMLPFPEAAIDVDKISDLRLVEDILSVRNS